MGRRIENGKPIPLSLRERVGVRGIANAFSTPSPPHPLPLSQRERGAWAPVAPRPALLNFQFSIFLLFLLFANAATAADRTEPLPKELRDVGVTEHLGDQLPLDTPFVDSSGRRIKLGDCFDGTRPVILTMNYSDCPMLCSLQLNGLLEALRGMPWDIGKQYQIVTISINPLETPQRSQLTKQKYLKLYARAGCDAGWHFLTSPDEAAIKKVAKTVGFGYAWLADQKQYAHPATLMLCTPAGRVSRYLGGVVYDPQTLRLSLVEAAEGKVGTTYDQVLLFCFHYDATKGRYAPAAMNVMRAGALVTMFLVAGLIWFLGRKRRHMVAVALLAQINGSFWLPPPGSTAAPVIDNVFYILLAISTFFFVLIVLLMIVFVFLYRRRPGVDPGPTTSHNTPLEIAWTAIPLGIVTAVFYVSFQGYMELRTSPREAYEIRVTGQKWKWLFTYPSNGHVDENLHVPVGQPVRLTMSSEDVIHSLYIPAFRVKMDVVPGRYTYTWFNAVEPGQYDLLCSEYCGTQHSDMLAKVVVHPPGEFKKWLADAGDFMKKLTPAEAGGKLYQIQGCYQCHSSDGSARANGGPSFKGIYGKPVAFEGGTSATVDDNYIRESILEPQAKIVAGYGPIMNTYKGRLSDKEITAIIEYIKSLK